jgi:NAD(P)-dependent dehydrogenase (short-subunit alcohol dehydrogenase family)
MNLSARSVIVTGAGRGVGEAIALKACQAGAHVTAVDVHADNLSSVVGKAKAAGFSVHGVVADVSTVAGNVAAVAAAEARFGPLKAFVANAAIIRFADLLSTTEDDWDAIHRTNLKGVYLGIQSAIPALRRSGGGSIVVVSSILGFVGDPLLSAYGASKGGLRALCRSVAAGYARDNIRCNTICPGDVETDMMRLQLSFEKEPDQARARLLAQYPLGRFASPADVANAVLFLVSDEANYITGTDLVIDGGFLAKCYPEM